MSYHQCLLCCAPQVFLLPPRLEIIIVFGIKWSDWNDGCYLCALVMYQSHLILRRQSWYRVLYIQRLWIMQRIKGCGLQRRSRVISIGRLISHMEITYDNRRLGFVSLASKRVEISTVSGEAVSFFFSFFFLFFLCGCSQILGSPWTSRQLLCFCVGR